MRRWLWVGAVNLLVLVILAELSGALLFRFRHEQWIYSRAVANSSVQPAEAGRRSNAQQRLLRHPVLGFIRKPGITVRQFLTDERIARQFDGTSPSLSLPANNYGFFSAENYPTTSDPSDYVIAIVGGSVAQWFALQGGPYLSEALDQAGFTEALRSEGKRVRILNFAQGGFKQPQQLLTLSYFLSLGQKFDLVVNIDGFNELALGNINLKSGVLHAMPSFQHLQGLLQQQSSTSIAKLADRIREFELREAAAHAQAYQETTRSGLLWLLWSLHGEVQRTRLQRVRKSIESASEIPPDTLTHVNQAPAAVDNLELLAAFWRRSSETTARLLGAHKIGYLHVLQPNQYFGSRVFSSDERSIAINQRSPYRRAVEDGYPLLKKHGAMLTEKQINFYDASGLFDQEPGPVYADSCCHFNARGNRLVANAIARLIVEQPI